jgi:putative oxidoreductase
LASHPPTSRYVVRTMLFMGAYVAINVAAMAGLFEHLNQVGRVALALTVAVPVACQIWAAIAWMRDSDEFFRAMTAKRFILATGLAIAVASAWGFQELYAHAPHISAAMVYPLFWGAFGVVSPFVRSTRI